MKRSGSFTLGILLILIGGWFLAVQLIPSLEAWVDKVIDWPFWFIGPGLFFILAAIVSGVSGLAVPGVIISGIGGIFYYQDTTGDYQSWAYMWTLIIGFVGIGVFIMHLLDGRPRKALKEGGNAIVTSVIMFLIFGSIFRAIFDQPALLGDWWPVLLIIAGVWALIRPLLFNPKRRKIDDDLIEDI